MITTIIVAALAFVLCVLLPLAVEIRNASKALVTAQNESNKIPKPLTLEEQLKVKEYAVLFGLDNDNVIDTRALLNMGHIAAGHIGKEAVEEILSTCSAIKLALRLRFRRTRVKCIIEATKLLSKQSRFTLLVSHLIGGDLDEEGNISI